MNEISLLQWLILITIGIPSFILTTGLAIAVVKRAWFVAGRDPR